MYHHIAPYSDWSGAEAFSEFIITYLLTQFKEVGIESESTVLDLGCGTGLTTIRLAEAAYHLIGLDNSSAMLSIAKEKPTSNIEWLESDMTTFSLENSVGCIYSVYDSLNHIPPEKLRRVFERCFENLKPGGWLFFDLNTLENYREFWQGKDSFEAENANIRVDTDFDEINGKATATYLIQQHTDDGYVETYETIEQYYFSNEFVEIALKEAGFTSIQSDDLDVPNQLIGMKCETKKAKPLKTFWKAKKV